MHYMYPSVPAAPYYGAATAKAISGETCTV